MATTEQIDRLFAPIADTVEDFAQKHSLSLEKYARGNTGWELAQRRSEGGTVLLYDDTLGLGVGSVWHFLCPEMSMQYSHFRPMAACQINAKDVAARLDEEMRGISAVQFGYWTHMRPFNET
jgi:hypothetical protein